MSAPRYELNMYLQVMLACEIDMSVHGFTSAQYRGRKHNKYPLRVSAKHIRELLIYL